MAYRADIEIGVRGARDLEQLRSAINQTARAVDSLNEVVGQRGRLVQSIQNYTSNLDRAAQSLKRVGAGTEAETKAVREYVQILGQATTARERQNNLIEDQIRLQQTAARTARLAAGGIRENANQYAGPIGPGAASPVALSSQLRGRTEQILAERAGTAALTAVLQAQFEAEQKLVNSKLDAKAARVQAALDKEAAAAAESATQIKKLSDRQLEFTERTEAAARAARTQTAEFIRQQRIAKQTRTLSAQTPDGGFPVEGPMASPGFRGMQKNVGKFGENLALGAGFPLLFGGGAGSVLGSIAGSFVGTGFGGQILGGALGQALDQTLVKVQTIGNAIKTLDFSKLTESGVKFTREVQTQLNVLLSVGDTLNAQKIVSQEVARQTGTLPGVTEDVANSVNILGDSWNKVVSTVGTLVGIVGAPLAVALAGILEAVAAIARAVNGLVSLFGNGVKTAAEFVIKLVAGEEALKFINDGIRNLNTGLSEAVSQAAELRNSLNETNVNTSIELAAARQMTPGVAPRDKLANIEVERQKDLNLLFQEEISARVKIRAENAKAGDEVVASLIKQNDLLYKNKAELIQINATRTKTAEIQRQQEDLERKAAQAAEKAARLAEEAARAQERAFAARINAATALYTAEKQSFDLQVQDKTIFEGREAASKQRLKDLTQVQFLDSEILRGERALALLEAQKTNTVAETNRLYDRRLANLNQEYALQKAQLQIDINRSLLEKSLAATQRRESIQSAVDPIREQQARVQLNTAGLSMSSVELERQQLALDQIYRLRQAELPVMQEINRINTEINSLALTDEATAAKKLDLATEQQKLAAIREELGLLSQLEQQQLKLNQLMQQYGNLVVDELSTAMSSAVTAVITGTGTVQEAFATMFQNIGKAFIDMATQMIAQALVMKVLGIFTGGATGSGGGFGAGLFSGAGPVAMPAAGVGGGASMFMPGAPSFMAKGGFVTGPTRAIVGEGGEAEYVIPASKMRGAMSRYAAGARGASVIPGAGGGGGGPMGGGGGGAIDVRYTVERINSVDYVTADQFQRGMAQAAQQGAVQGEQRAMRSLKTSAATRRSVGV